MKKHEQNKPATIGLKNGNAVLAFPQKDHYSTLAGERIEYSEVAWFSTDTDRIEVRG